MKREYLVRGILATVFAIILLIVFFFGIKYFTKESCNKSDLNKITINKDCLKVNPGCNKNTLEITNNCDKYYIINNYDYNSKVEYSDLTGSIKNIIININKDVKECNYENLTLISPLSEKDLLELDCNNLYIPINYKTIILTDKNFIIKNQDIDIEGSWK